MHPRNFGSQNIVRTYVQGEILNFKHPYVSAVNRLSTPKNINKGESFFRLNLMCTLTFTQWSLGRGQREREK